MNIARLQKAIIASNKAAALLDQCNEELRAHFDGNQIDIFHQAGDEWVILSGHDTNTPLDKVDLKHLLTLDYNQAIEYLKNGEI
jgi:hypothetical protein